MWHKCAERISYQLGMPTLELSSYVLEIQNDSYTTLSQNMIGCSTLISKEYIAIASRLVDIENHGFLNPCDN